MNQKTASTNQGTDDMGVLTKIIGVLFVAPALLGLMLAAVIMALMPSTPFYLLAFAAREWRQLIGKSAREAALVVFCVGLFERGIAFFIVGIISALAFYYAVLVPHEAGLIGLFEAIRRVAIISVLAFPLGLTVLMLTARYGFDGLDDHTPVEVSGGTGVAQTPESAVARPLPTSSELAAIIREDIIGQDENIQSISRLVIERMRAPKERGPVATFMLAGPTGSGKTEVTRRLAAALGLPWFAVRCNEYADKNSINRLLGFQASYMNADVGGELTNALKSSRKGVLVLDEIEKAHPTVAKVLMTLLDEGTVTEAFDGATIDGRGWIILATTNAAHEAIADASQADLNDAELRIGIKSALAGHWPPEILGRLDKVLAFRKVMDNPAVIDQLLDKVLRTIGARLPMVEITVAPEARVFMRGLSKTFGRYGFRELERYLDDVVIEGLDGRHHDLPAAPAAKVSFWSRQATPAKAPARIRLKLVMEGRNLRARVIES